MMSNDKESKKGITGQECLTCSKCECDCGKRSNLDCTNWLGDIPGNDFEIVEVQFKNTRKGFYRNSAHLPLEVGDMVAVEANPGHDIGRVSMMGNLVKLQMKKANLKPGVEILRVFRKAKASDLERFEQAKAKEVDTMIRSRQIAADLKLKMKIGDVEYQGDGNKAIFYYIADERVDFRQLIKVLADTFHVRIEMKQIGARQEAGRIGGTGPCGRELCCATWMKNFVSVSTNAARYQDISLNPQKLAGMCAKLKCCLNYEVDNYVEASRKMPPKDAVLQTADGEFHQFKVDILAGLITYSSDKNLASNLETITAARAKEIIEMNKQGEKPLSLMENGKVKETSKSIDLLNESDLSRFDKAKKKKKNKNRNANRPEKGDNRQPNGNRPEKSENRQPNGNRPEKNENRQPNGNNRNRDNRNKGPRQQGNRPQQGNNNKPQQGNNKPQQANNKPQQGNNKPQQANNNNPQQGENNKPQEDKK